jgi:hypothetical protein
LVAWRNAKTRRLNRVSVEEEEKDEERRRRGDEEE